MDSIRAIDKLRNLIKKRAKHSSFGKIYKNLKGKYHEAKKILLLNKSGDAIGALNHKELGYIDLVYGEEGTGRSDGFGLAKIAKYHPEVLNNLDEIIYDMPIVKKSTNRVKLETEDHFVSIRLEWDGESKHWLLTAFEKDKNRGNSRTDIVTKDSIESNDGMTTPSPTYTTSITQNKDDVNMDSIPENLLIKIKQATRPLDKMALKKEYDGLSNLAKMKLKKEYDVGVGESTSEKDTDILIDATIIDRLSEIRDTLQAEDFTLFDLNKLNRNITKIEEVESSLLNNELYVEVIELYKQAIDRLGDGVTVDSIGDGLFDTVDVTMDSTNKVREFNLLLFGK